MIRSMMENPIEWIAPLEINPKCAIKYKRSQVVTDAHIHSLQHTYTLHGHDGCVNTISWNDSGTLLASGSDDQNILLWHQNGRLLHRLPTVHSNNIFSILFVPHARDHLILSAAGDNQILLHELHQLPKSNDQTSHIQRWECGGRVKKLITCHAEPRIFWSASEDGLLKQYDLRDNSTIDYNFLDIHGPLKSLAINEICPQMLAIGISNPMVPIYDRRNMKEPLMRLLPAHLSMGSEGRFLATSLAFNQRGDELLVNIGSDNIYIFDVCHPDNHKAPNVLSTLKNYLSDHNTFSLVKNMELNGTIREEFQTESNESRQISNEVEYSCTIDKCSEALAAHMSKNGLSWNIFSIQLDTLDRKIANRIQMQLSHSSKFLTSYLLIRGRTYMERNWEGDQLAAIRDFLSTLKIHTNDRTAHLNLVKSLYLLGQYQLARKCFLLYQKLNADDVTAEQVIRKLEQDKPKEDTLEWDQLDSENYRDYLHSFTGHLNINTDIKEANWFGGDEQYIVAGSDCGSIFIWERKTQRVVRVFKGDNYTVNCIQPHPNRCLLATSGIDNVIRFWEPSSTALKEATERDKPDESDKRDLTMNRYDIMRRNRRKRTPELVWEQLLNSVGLGIFRVDSTQEQNDEEMMEEEVETEEGTPHVIRCRQM